MIGLAAENRLSSDDVLRHCGRFDDLFQLNQDLIPGGFMSEKASPKPGAIRARALEASTEFQRLANHLSERIKLLDTWIDGLPSKTMVMDEIEDPEDKSHQYTLMVYRELPGGWGIFYSHDKKSEFGEPKRLAGAPLKVKILLSSALETLLKKHAESQEQRIPELLGAHGHLSKLFEENGIEEEIDLFEEEGR